MSVRRQVEKALRSDAPAGALAKLGEEGVLEAWRIALDEDHPLTNAAAMLLSASGPEKWTERVLSLGLAGHARALGLAATMGALAVERALALYPTLPDEEQRFRARLVLSWAQPRDPRAVPLLIEGLRAGDPPKLLARLGGPDVHAALADEIRARPLTARPSDAEIDAQLDLIGALAQTGPLPADLERRKALLRALAARSLREGVDGQFEGVPRLAQTIQPLGHQIAPPKRAGS